MNDTLMNRLRKKNTDDATGSHGSEWAGSDVKFVSSSPKMENRFDAAVRELMSCLKPAGDSIDILHEGGIYHGCWLESTGTISGEILSRFLPDTAENTFLSFARSQREDGLIPYKLTQNGPVFSQIQLVTPLARSVWNHYRLHGRKKELLKTMYHAMARYDSWLSEWRNTRGTGCVEAFCAFDTGHDLSARFWHIPDSPHGNDPKKYDRDNPLLPYLAPDLTANVACQRSYLGLMARELDLPDDDWTARAAESRKALYDYCFHDEDRFFYDIDQRDRPVRIQSDNLLRVLACEMGRDDFFAEALKKYLLNTGKFFAKYPFTSLALDDPRYDPSPEYNSWCGTSNFLSLIRSPHAFEYHGRYTELTWVMQPVLSALYRSERFAQNLNPHTGEMGFTETYSPSILCLLDFTERLCGILPRSEGTLWFTCLTPYQMEHRHEFHETAYGRTVEGIRFELLNGKETSRVFRNDELLYQVPRGIRIVTDRMGELLGITGMTGSPVSGEIMAKGRAWEFSVKPNERWHFTGDSLERVGNPGLVMPSY